ncbi:MAG TPA: Hpt domain-containing protein [Candidatus Binataceae bacterium]|nr:Hpt domain-containing protein [Candidatus Binataceae bacterium]
MSQRNGTSPRGAPAAPAAANPVGDAGDDGAVSRARLQRLRESLSGKEAVVDELIDLFAADLPIRVAAIGDAIDRGDASALALQAHGLRSGAGNFGARRLDEVCGRLEQAGLSGTLDAAAAMLAELACEAERVRRALLEFRSQDAIAMPAPTPAPPRRSGPQ